jgi:hypothetical protein
MEGSLRVLESYTTSQTSLQSSIQLVLVFFALSVSLPLPLRALSRILKHHALRK